jgi:hypothetical protein
MDENVYFIPDHQTSSWIIDQFTCRIQTSDPKITEQIRSWTFTKLVGSCIVGPIRIFSIPRSQWRWALEHLGIQLPDKNPKRAAHGTQLGRQAQIKGSIGHSREKLKAITAEIFEEAGEEGRADADVFLKPKSALELIHQRDGFNEPKRRFENS